MRKLTILLAAAALAASTSGCCGRCKNWFYKGSPCGTTMAPAVLSAPMAMGAPLAGPVVQPNCCCEQQAQPVMCVPCDPCQPCDPCATTGVSTGSFGGYLQNASDCGCDSTGVTMTPGTLAPAGTIPAYPAPGT